MNAATQAEITHYVEQVRSALADLPDQVRGELLEDLPEHLAEVLAEGDGTLVDRLGDPTEYAAELRTSAALDAPAATPGVGHRAAVAWQATRDRLGRIDRRIGPVLGYGTASEFLRSLRPSWWVLRGYLAATLFAYLAAGELVGPLPAPGGSIAAGVLVLTGMTIGSVWLGRRGQRLSRWPRRATVVASALVVLCSAAFVLFPPAEEGPVVVMESNGGAAYLSPPLPSSASPLDVYVYDSQGRLIEGARLFDENGEPILLGFPNWCELPGLEQLRVGQSLSRMGGRITLRDSNVQYTYPFCPERNPFELPALPPSPDTTPAPSPSVPGPSPS
ncbi:MULTISPECIES: HAAS signaling domain-containing protein [unclassified Micromonospora]|uniref:HAAS signaling domain-containing protein n=1 Tax=unclassified Micromonospora TaxID=2617518 RepID=UPI003A85546B